MERDIVSILRGINEDPEDDTLRLIAADWYEEYGQVERGEFIRVQVELALMQMETTARVKRGGQQSGRPCRHLWPEMCANCRNLVKRERALLQDHGFCWLSDEFHNQTDWLLREAPTYQRGFVGRIELPLAAFMKHAGVLFRDHPITEVVLLGKGPSVGLQGVGYEWYTARSWKRWWEDEDPDDLPMEFVPYLTEVGGTERGHYWIHFLDRAAAMTAASHACVRHGCKEAGVVRKGWERGI